MNINLKKEAILLRQQNQSLRAISDNIKVPVTTLSRWLKNIKTTKSTHPLYKINEIQHDYFSEENMKKFPHRFILVGFIAADGCVHKRKTGQKSLYFNLSQADSNAIHMINKEISNNTRGIYFNCKTNSEMWSVPSDQICQDLKRFNIVSRKTAKYSMPPNLSLKETSYFLRGYFYGDGCVSGQNTKRVYHIIGSKTFANDVKKFLEQEKIVDCCTIFPIKNSEYFQIILKGRKGAMFSQFIFTDELMMLLPRKHIVSQEIISRSLWTERENKLLQHLPLKEFCKISGRTEKSAKSHLIKVK